MLHKESLGYEAKNSSVIHAHFNVYFGNIRRDEDPPKETYLFYYYDVNTGEMCPVEETLLTYNMGEFSMDIPVYNLIDAPKDSTDRWFLNPEIMFMESTDETSQFIQLTYINSSRFILTDEIEGLPAKTDATYVCNNLTFWMGNDYYVERIEGDTDDFGNYDCDAFIVYDVNYPSYFDGSHNGQYVQIRDGYHRRELTMLYGISSYESLDFNVIVDLGNRTATIVPPSYNFFLYDIPFIATNSDVNAVVNLTGTSDHTASLEHVDFTGKPYMCDFETFFDLTARTYSTETNFNVDVYMGLTLCYYDYYTKETIQIAKFDVDNPIASYSVELHDGLSPALPYHLAFLVESTITFNNP